ncbi:MAG: TetR/AcrR family transcriptional regulator [Saprospiraceae bacterium]|nr:TetR/AcrR family transcriptional regulator [Saprospiraceae bacterium]
MRTRDEVKERTISDLAIRMIAKEGLERFSLQKLARQAGVSPATLYIYYKDKEDLIHSIGSKVSDALFEHSLIGFHHRMNFAEGLRVQWQNRARYLIDHPTEVQFYEVLRHSNHYRDIQARTTRSFKGVMNAFVQQAIANGELKALPFEVYWSIAFAPLYQLIKFHNQGYSYVNPDFRLSEDLMMQTLDLVLHALKP